MNDEHTQVGPGAFADMRERLERLEHSAKEHGLALKEHRHTIKEHGATLQEHDMALREHTTTLGSHGAQLKEMTQTLAQLIRGVTHTGLIVDAVDLKLTAIATQLGIKLPRKKAKP